MFASGLLRVRLPATLAAALVWKRARWRADTNSLRAVSWVSSNLPPELVLAYFNVSLLLLIVSLLLHV